jgi:hypothetical protein
MRTKSLWHKISDEKPKDEGLFWVYLPGCIYKKGILFGFWDGFSFNYSTEDGEDVTHWQKIIRPKRPRFLKRKR